MSANSQFLSENARCLADSAWCLTYPRPQRQGFMSSFPCVQGSAECNLHRTNAVQAGSLDLIDLSLVFWNLLVFPTQRFSLVSFVCSFERCPLQICCGFGRNNRAVEHVVLPAVKWLSEQGQEKLANHFSKAESSEQKGLFNQCKAISEGGLCGKHFYRKGKLVKRSGPFSELLNSDNRDLLLSFLPKARFSNAPLNRKENRKLQTESQSLAIFAKKNHKTFWGKDGFGAIFKEIWIEIMFSVPKARPWDVPGILPGCLGPMWVFKGGNMYGFSFLSSEGDSWESISEPVVWGTHDLPPQTRVVLFIVVVSVISLNPLVCGCLSCLRRFRDSRRFREGHQVANHRFGKARNNRYCEIPEGPPKVCFLSPWVSGALFFQQVSRSLPSLSLHVIWQEWSLPPALWEAQPQLPQQARRRLPVIWRPLATCKNIWRVLQTFFPSVLACHVFTWVLTTQPRLFWQLLCLEKAVDARHINFLTHKTLGQPAG